ncbi:hypothetical protein ACIA8O_15075 [Kitasatospora sp. NPDC051853]|uniref:hypothetical protein n=1 Tax=Kitasatospora sp. NPDC051853 TaxID=3364058 RepID=UPI003788351B
MTTTCPQCGHADRTVPVPQALAEAPDHSARLALSPPAEPLPAGLDGLWKALLILAAIALAATFGQGTWDADGDTAFGTGYRLGALLPFLLLLTSGLVGLARARAKARRADRDLPVRQVRWRHARQLWESAVLCRRCEAAFLPGAPVVPVAEFRAHLTTVAERAHGVSEPTDQPA